MENVYHISYGVELYYHKQFKAWIMRIENKSCFVSRCVAHKLIKFSTKIHTIVTDLCIYGKWH